MFHTEETGFIFSGQLGRNAVSSATRLTALQGLNYQIGPVALCPLVPQSLPFRKLFILICKRTLADAKLFSE